MSRNIPTFSSNEYYVLELSTVYVSIARVERPIEGKTRAEEGISTGAGVMFGQKGNPRRPERDLTRRAWHAPSHPSRSIDRIAETQVTIAESTTPERRCN